MVSGAVARRSLTIAMAPGWLTAKCRGVCSRAFSLSTDDPISKRSLATDHCPVLHAKCNGVSPCAPPVVSTEISSICLLKSSQYCSRFIHCSASVHVRDSLTRTHSRLLRSESTQSVRAPDCTNSCMDSPSCWRAACRRRDSFRGPYSASGSSPAASRLLRTRGRLTRRPTRPILMFALFLFRNCFRAKCSWGCKVLFCRWLTKWSRSSSCSIRSLGMRYGTSSRETPADVSSSHCSRRCLLMAIARMFWWGYFSWNSCGRQYSSPACSLPGSTCAESLPFLLTCLVAMSLSMSHTRLSMFHCLLFR
mmetsp:Transcript_74082/g.130751  ORF Transcript_74082/g.130751 Transcript_74082/m.130751 type:complete len:307 (-) Transcript_74082:4182-5102(-)